MSEISGHTKLIALLGSPVEHSLSPAIHNLSFAKEGVDAVYLVADVTPDTLENAIIGARALGLAGLNVTMPCKTHVLQYLDGLSPAAELMGAVNTVVREGDKLIGHNTDGAGALRAAKEAGVTVSGKKVTVLGAGGAGSAVFTQAALDGATEISVFNVRDEFYDSTEVRLAELTERTGATLTLYDLADEARLQSEVAESVLVVDATRVGMPPFENESNIKPEWMKPGQAFMDTVYHPRETKLLKLAKEAGATAIGGLGMLLWQAALGEKLWLDVDMDVAYIEEKVFSEAE